MGVGEVIFSKFQVKIKKIYFKNNNFETSITVTKYGFKKTFKTIVNNCGSKKKF